ncbi:hypothetical protein ABB37_03387 [Leptomonas pyrrhocoris]|uniref:Uncharacterized protein n=1 Tax=Leptomonas pyrrhocoris TaxID=157538 RepID=A0A0M9G521_LEPPY|nr:hypothetical protein ABB37_03387 [Leptomonas pyrrhocoris]KPA82279.1 hypothetical protein ABB37_03387 [Leptomonas pyrrhocoris]|eukprot:XP_015660718.1 hypothetical protein ABB37_03387 [Leptomonas pyrrhocoris]
MQQIFADEAASQSPKPLISFPLPSDVHLLSSEGLASTRKRHRSLSQEEESTDATAPSPLTQEDCKALRRFIEYGDQPMTAVEFFQRTTGHRSTPAQVFTSGTAVSRLSVPLPYQWCSAALQQTLSLLCRVIRLDTASFYLQPASTAEALSGAPFAASLEGAAAPTVRVTTLELYCRFQALELEFEDVVLRAQSVTQADGVPEALTQRARADVEETVRCIEDGVNSLEATLIEMLLHIEDPRQAKEDGAIRGASAGNGTKMNAGTAAAPSLAYVAGILRDLPGVFHLEQWPARFICETEANKLPPTASSSSAPPRLQHEQQPPSPGSVAAALLSGGSVVRASASDTAGHTEVIPFPSAAAYRAQVGGATTSLALQSLLDISKADVWNIFGVAAASPISRLAALEKLENASQGRTLNDVWNAAPPARPALDIEQLEFKDILVRAWNHGYSLLGLRRLCFEMQALFYQYVARVTTAAPPASSHATRQEIYELWCQWQWTVQRLFQGFMMKVTGGAPSLKETGAVRDSRCKYGGDADLNACALLRRHASLGSALAEVQHIALRVVTKLQAVDAKGWFAVPAFDLVNVDFTSVRYWVMSPSFAPKSRREAYRALCRVLERMVDSCVHKYGPTHPFSDVITNVRQQLVDVARAEGLL